MELLCQGQDLFRRTDTLSLGFPRGAAAQGLHRVALSRVRRVRSPWGRRWLLRGASQANPAEPQALSPASSPPPRVLLPQLTCLVSRPSHHSCSAGPRHSAHPETLTACRDQGGKQGQGAAGEAGVPPHWVWGLSLLVFLLGLSDPF